MVGRRERRLAMYAIDMVTTVTRKMITTLEGIATILTIIATLPFAIIASRRNRSAN